MQCSTSLCCEKKIKLGNSEHIVTISLYRFTIALRCTFGTSHSSSNHRTNALIKVEVTNGKSGKSWKGFGEIGLPPKKKYCYLANFDDIHFYMKIFLEQVEQKLKTSIIHQVGDWKQVKKKENEEYCPFKHLDMPYFSKVRSGSEQMMKEEIEVIPFLILKAIDEIQVKVVGEQEVEFHRTAKCGIEMAVLDLWAILREEPLYELIHLCAPKQKYSFYTASLNEDIHEIEKAALFGLQHTPFLKIKLDSDLPKGIEILKRLDRLFEKHVKDNSSKNLFSDVSLESSLNGKNSLHNNNEASISNMITLFEDTKWVKWSIDANASWTPELTLDFVKTMKKEMPNLMKRLYMIEQPFSVDFLHENDETGVKSKEMWRLCKEECEKEGIFIFADESVSTWEDVLHLKEYVHGVNIKLEKAGGIRGALRAALVAKKHGLQVWFGMMVASRLSASASAHLLSLADIGGDLDGSLLASEQSQQSLGGFQWISLSDAANSKKDMTWYGRVELEHDMRYGIGVEQFLQ